MFPMKKFSRKFGSISSENDLKNFIQESSAHVTQTTLYGYIKTRIGSRYAIMFEDSKFVDSINIAKWNIYMSALSDCTLYTYSYLIDQKNFKKDNAEFVFNSILEKEKENGLESSLFQETKLNFSNKIKTINWNTFYQDKPFENSCQALYRWAPIAEELKTLDKEIVLNSMKLKWNLIENEFKEYTKNLKCV